MIIAAKQAWRSRAPHATGRSSWAVIGVLPVIVMLATFAASARADSAAYGLEAKSEFGVQLTDAARTGIVVYSVPPVTTYFACDTNSARVANQIFVAVVALPGLPSSLVPCSMGPATVYVGPLAPGIYQVMATVSSPSGHTLATLSMSIAITARGAKCNANPFVNQIAVTPVLSFADFRTRFKTDPAYRALFGDVDYVDRPGSAFGFLAFPPLQDPVRELAHLQQTGELKSEYLNDNACFSGGPPDVVRTVVEYHNILLDHYFMTPDAGEQAAIEAGNVGAGWVRTGNDFKAVVIPGCPVGVEGGFHPVYRFAGVPNIGPNSHFFTVSQDECAVVRDRNEWHWQFEGAPFWASEPAHGTCPPNTKSLYRVYNDGMGGTPNHRYSTDIAIITAMVAKGWINEGLRMCVLP